MDFLAQSFLCPRCFCLVYTPARIYMHAHRETHVANTLIQTHIYTCIHTCNLDSGMTCLTLVILPLSVDDAIHEFSREVAISGSRSMSVGK